MSRPAEDYRAALAGLLPSGPAWPREPQAPLMRLLAGLAQGLAAVDTAGDALRDEADPGAAVALLSDWERVCGLPMPCLDAVAQTVEERQAAVVTRLRATGGASAAYFIALAASVGRSIAIEEFRPLRSGFRAGARAYGVPWAYAWRVRVLGFDASTAWARAGRMRAGEPIRTGSALTTVWARAGTMRAGDRIVRWDDTVVECLVRALRPAHTTVLFSYGDAE